MFREIRAGVATPTSVSHTVLRSRHSFVAVLYFWDTLAGTCGAVLITLTLPSEAWLLSVSRTRKNFSASMAASTGG
jgi:hypothetical protein